MKALISVVVVMVLIIGAKSEFATGQFQLGFEFGVSDGRGSCNAPSNVCGEGEYISHWGNSFAFHTPEFNRGYVAGWCSVNPPHTGSSLDEALWDCDKGPDSWNYEIKG
jgi:hypothetical protein